MNSLINKKNVSVRNGSGRIDLSPENIAIHSQNFKSGILDFSVEQSGSYLITLAQPNGTVVNRLQTRNLMSGHHSVRFNINTIVSGMYILSIKGNTSFISKKWTLSF